MSKLAVLFVMLFFLVVPAVIAQQQMDDVLYLKDGSVVRGQIIEQVPNVSIKIQTRDGSIFTHRIEDIEKVLKEPSPNAGKRKSPAMACLLSLLIPGTGQHYNGEHTKGVIQEVLFVGGIVLFINTANALFRFDFSPEQGTKLTIASFLTYGSWLWSVIDAPLSAEKINRRSQQWGHMVEYEGRNHSLGFDLGLIKRGVGAQVTLHF
jgi:hypothetical protein